MGLAMERKWDLWTWSDLDGAWAWLPEVGFMRVAARKRPAQRRAKLAKDKIHKRSKRR